MTASPPRHGDGAADPWAAHAARIVAITDEAPGVRTYGLAFEDPPLRAAYRFVPGQFNMLYLPGIGEAAISVSSDPAAAGTLAHTVRAVGNVTDALGRLSVGDQLFVRGPFGAAWPLERALGRHVVAVAGGVGVASLRAAILHLAVPGRCRRLTVLHGARRADGLIYAGDHAAWRRLGVDVRATVEEADPAWPGPVGLVTALVADAIPDPAATTVLCCGPDAMMAGVAEAAVARGVGADDVFLALERTMACAVAHCGLCQFGPLFVCRDGPVLRYDRIAALMRIPRL